KSKEISWIRGELNLRDRLRTMIDPLQLALNTLNEKQMILGIRQITSQKKLDFSRVFLLQDDQLTRLSEIESKLIPAVKEAFQRVQKVSQNLTEALESEQESQLNQAIHLAQEIPVSSELARHLTEPYGCALLIRAMKFHIAE